MAEYFAKCWLCSKGFPSASVLRDHLQTVHHESAAATAAAMAALQPPPPPPAAAAAAVAAAAAAVNSSANAVATTSSLSPTSSSSVVGVVTGHKTHTCLQCNASFSERDELERHELTHSPTAQVVLKRRLESSNKY